MNTTNIVIEPTRKYPSSWNTEKVILVLIYCGFLFGIGNSQVDVQINDLFFIKALRVASIGLSLFICFIFLMQQNALRHISCRTILPIVCYCAVCFLSTATAPIPLLTFYKSLEMLLMVLFCCISIENQQTTASELFEFVIKLITISVIVVLAEAISLPSRAFIKMNQSGPFLGYMLYGVFPTLNANVVGFLGGLVACAVLPFTLAGRYRIWMLLLLLIAMVVTVLSYSRMAIMAFFVAATVIFWMLSKHNKLILVVILALGLALGLVLTQETIRSSVVDHLSRGRNVGNVEELSSGRLGLWDYTITENSNILLGGGFATALRQKQYLGYSFNAHSSIIEVYAGIGLVGLVIWIWMVGRILISLYRIHSFSIDSDWIVHTSVCGVMVFVLVKSLASNMLVDLNYGFFTVACIVVYIEKKMNSIPMSAINSRK